MCFCVGDFDRKVAGTCHLMVTGTGMALRGRGGLRPKARANSAGRVILVPEVAQ